MLTAEQNKQLTQVGPGTPMGELLRRYWMPVAGVSEFEQQAFKPVRLLGEDLLLYKDEGGRFGLIGRHCPHRGADLSLGMVEAEGVRCHYHGWRFDAAGRCVERPFEHNLDAGQDEKARTQVRFKGYPVEAKGGLLWAYMGPLPAPLLPDWEAFSWDNGFTQIVLSEVPCNWFQCQENSIDPVHFEWMHENWGRRLRTGEKYASARHLKLAFEEFEYGMVYRRVRENMRETDEAWTIGRVCLWPNGFFLGEHFEWRVPIDDHNTLSVTWKYMRVPKEREPYVQKSIPVWVGPVKDEQGRWIDTHVMNQDFIAWVGQGVIADRTVEHLGASDQGVVLMRRRFFEQLEALAAGKELKGIIRDPARNVRIALPIVYRDHIVNAHTAAEILAHPTMSLQYKSYIFQAGQPEEIRRQACEAVGFEMPTFTGVVAARQA